MVHFFFAVVFAFLLLCSWVFRVYGKLQITNLFFPDNEKNVTTISEERSFCRNFQIRKFPNPDHARAIRVLLVPFRFQGRVRRRTYSTEFRRRRRRRRIITYFRGISYTYGNEFECWKWDYDERFLTRVTLVLVFFFDNTLWMTWAVSIGWTCRHTYFMDFLWKNTYFTAFRIRNVFDCWCSVSWWWLDCNTWHITIHCNSLMGYMDDVGR